VASAELVGAGADVEVLALAGVDAGAVTRGLAFTDDPAALGGQVVPVAPAVGVLRVTFRLSFAAAVVLSLAVAGEVVVLALPVVGVVAVPVAVAVAESLFPELPLVPVAVGFTGVVVVGVGTGLAGSVARAVADDDDGDGHTVAGTLLCGADVTPWVTPPPVAPLWVADPFRLGTPPPILELELELELEIPTAEPSWTKAWRSGGSARTTPTANTAQAAASAGRSSPYRQSRCGRSPPSAASCPPRAAFQRRTIPARKPPLGAECLPTRVGPELTRARIRSSPSGRGSS
jgi:hypothetical protein